MTRLPPTLFALLLIIVTAILSAVAVGALAASPKGSMLSVPTGLPLLQTSPTASAGRVPGPLDGLRTPRQRTEGEPIAAMIDNFAAARPQSGLSRASVVFEAPVESGITRIMPIFLERDAASLGPIRSARPYFLDWALPFHPLFVHDGGSPAAQRLVRSMRGLVDVDSARTGTAFYRSRGSLPPHNLFTGTPAVRTLAGLRNWNMPAALGALPHNRRPKLPLHLTAQTVSIRFASPGFSPNPAYTVSYRFDPGADAYLRSVGGVPAVDSLTGRQIRVSNVVVLDTTISPIPNDPLGRIAIRTIGHGKAVVFQSGRERSGRWAKSSRAALLRLVSAGGSSIRLNPGATWFEVVSPGSVAAQ